MAPRVWSFFRPPTMKLTSELLASSHFRSRTLCRTFSFFSLWFSPVSITHRTYLIESAIAMYPPPLQTTRQSQPFATHSKTLGPVSFFSPPGGAPPSGPSPPLFHIPLLGSWKSLVGLLASSRPLLFPFPALFLFNREDAHEC